VTTPPIVVTDIGARLVNVGNSVNWLESADLIVLTVKELLPGNRLLTVDELGLERTLSGEEVFLTDFSTVDEYETDEPVTPPSPPTPPEKKGRTRDKLASELGGVSASSLARHAKFVRAIDELSDIYGSSLKSLVFNTNKFTDKSLHKLLELHYKDSYAAKSVFESVVRTATLTQKEVSTLVQSALDEWFDRQVE